ncbi:response regulator transcription factor [Chitinophaga japonensis]|uniref:DNA-binding response OmpR family regulator n=1 Tax=Chitinophaga japonensis TaxID=104662 RepID=A0A562TBA7_CHIJA|nr:response regulator transcription factor [Chitinophaga japonensis]TWI90845.1 DNA-binding response OmpR family regulator [Chitinophaga japonensis]
MNRKTKILLVDDDYYFGGVVKKQLEAKGYDVVLCFDGEIAWKRFQKEDFDIILLDVMMPKKDGFTLAQEIRRKNGLIPILFITSRKLDEDRLEGFRQGGDDYITKPFSMAELEARIRVFLKRTLPRQHDNKNEFKLGKLTFSAEYLHVKDANGTIIGAITPREVQLIRYFKDNANQILKREEILLNVWGKDGFFSGRSMDVFITRMRKHFKADPQIQLETLHNVGFRLNIPEEAGPGEAADTE